VSEHHQSGHRTRERDAGTRPAARHGGVTTVAAPDAPPEGAADGETVGAGLYRRFTADPHRVVLRLVAADGSAAAVTADELRRRSMAYAARYSAAGAAGEVVGVCLYHGLDLYAAFIGAVWAGAIPTMLPPPSPRIEPQKYVRSFTHMLEHVRPYAVAVDTATRDALRASHDLAVRAVVLVDPESLADDELPAPVPAAPDDVVLLQHSSGTTGLQKGIALSNRAVAAHNRAYAARLGITPDDVIVSWLPLYHDMGFVACFLMPLLGGVPVVAMSQFDWVLNPGMLLEQIHRHRGTLCWLPNFAYSFLAKRSRGQPGGGGLDLSCVRAWINSSEPVLEASHRAFVERFRAAGVSQRQLTASYAMAENVYAVTQSLPGEYRTLAVESGPFRQTHRAVLAAADDPAPLVFVSNGRPVEGTAVRVIDEAGVVLPERAVGEIALRGHCTFSGYFRRPDLTAAAVTADGWYRTGDLGFLHEGELYVTGRRKDLVIIQGRNFYPGDIERAAGEVEGVIPGRVVAFGVPDPASGTEGLVILAEVEEECRANERAIVLRLRTHIAQEFDCTPSAVRVVPPRWLVKSTSGKLARADNRDKYLASLPLA
jgi:fatty-acyl-CoA synthase